MLGPCRAWQVDDMTLPQRKTFCPRPSTRGGGPLRLGVATRFRDSCQLLDKQAAGFFRTASGFRGIPRPSHKRIPKGHVGRVPRASLRPSRLVTRASPEAVTTASRCEMRVSTPSARRDPSPEEGVLANARGGWPPCCRQTDTNKCPSPSSLIGKNGVHLELKSVLYHAFTA